MDNKTKIKLFKILQGNSTKAYVFKELLKLKQVGDEVELQAPDMGKDSGVATLRSYITKFKMLLGGEFRVHKGKDFKFRRVLSVSRCEPKADSLPFADGVEQRIETIKQRPSCKGFVFRRLDGIRQGESVQFTLPNKFNRGAAVEAVRAYRIMRRYDLLTHIEGKHYYIHRVSKKKTTSGEQHDI